MKKIYLSLMAAIIMLTTAACGPNKDEMNANATATIEAVHTRVAITLTAQAAMFTPTSPVLPTQTIAPTNTPEPTLTAGPTPTTLNLPVQNNADSGAYMADVTIPDDMVVAPGTAFTKTWQVYNNGGTTWTTEYVLAYVSGEAMSGLTTKLSQPVAPNTSANISIAMVAPTTPGTYTGYWKLKNTAGSYFGDQLSVKIIVGNGTVIATPTPIEISYTIQTGDTCDSISVKFKTTWSIIQEMNGFADSYCDPDKIINKVGKIISVPNNP